MYRDGYYERLSEAIRDNFPRVYHVFGDVAFREMLFEFAQHFPSRVRNLNEFGACLPGFLAERERGWLADLARLEWAAVESFFAGPLEKNTPMVAPPLEKWETTRVVLDPSVIPLELDWSVTERWDLNSAAEPRPGDFGAVVYRAWEKVDCQTVARCDARLLLRLVEGQSLAEVTDDLPPEEAPRIQTSFATWAKLGWIRGFE